MVVEELETGLFLDLPLQQYLKKFTASEATTFLLCDDLHAEENLKYFALICYKANALRNKTIYNPPLQNGPSTGGTSTGTGSGTGTEPFVPVIGTIQYRVSFFDYKGYTLTRIQNLSDNKESYVFKRKDLSFWSDEVLMIKKDFYH